MSSVASCVTPPLISVVPDAEIAALSPAPAIPKAPSPEEELAAARARLAEQLRIIDAVRAEREAARAPWARLRALSEAADSAVAELQGELARLGDREAAAIREWADEGGNGKAPSAAQARAPIERRLNAARAKAISASKAMQGAQEPIGPLNTRLVELEADLDAAVLGVIAAQFRAELANYEAARAAFFRSDDRARALLRGLSETGRELTDQGSPRAGAYFRAGEAMGQAWAETMRHQALSEFDALTAHWRAFLRGLRTSAETEAP